MRLIVLMLLLAAPLRAEPIRVVTDIGPVGAIMESLLGQHGEVMTLIPPGVSPHDYHMRPSEALALSQADLVVWMGPALTNWLAEPIETLAGNAAQLSLLDIPGTHLLPAREDVALKTHDHDHDHDNDDEAVDPHAWLDLGNAQHWLMPIAEALGQIDPANKGEFQQRAVLLGVAYAARDAELRALLAPLQGKHYLVLHDAFHYFEDRYGLTPIAAVSPSDASMPGAARIAALQDAVEENPIRCAFSEPFAATELLGAVLGNQQVEIVALDPLQAQRSDGPDRFTPILMEMGAAISTCLSKD